MKKRYFLFSIVLLFISFISLAQGHFTEKASMPTARLSMGTAVVDGKIYVIGGLYTETSKSSVLEVYDPVADSWDTKTSMPTPRGTFGCVVVDGKIYTIGGGVVGSSNLSTVEVYDPVTDSWDHTTGAKMPTARNEAAACTVNGKIYVIGGTVQKGGILPGISKVEEYDPVTNTWSAKKDKPTPAWGLRTCVLDGKIYVTGGNVKWPNISAALEVYDPVKDEWDITKTPMPNPKYSHSICAFNGNIYSFGGWNNCSSGPFYTKVEVYNPTTDTWTQKTDIPLTLGELSAVTVGDKIYIMGGTSTLHPFTRVNKVYEYDPFYVTSEKDVLPGDPSQFSLHQNLPNPFYSETTLTYELQQPETVQFIICNQIGEKVEIISKKQSTGKHRFNWNAEGLPAGVYFCLLKTKGKIQVIKMIKL